MISAVLAEGQQTQVNVSDVENLADALEIQDFEGPNEDLGNMGRYPAGQSDFIDKLELLKLEAVDKGL